MTSVQSQRLRALDHVLAVAEGSGPPITSSLGPDVQAWLASPEQGLKAAIESVHGAEAVNDALARLAPSTLTVVAAIPADTSCWAEVTRAGDHEPPETCIVGLAYDADGAVSRLVWLRAPIAPAWNGRDQPSDPSANRGSETPAPDGRPVLERYLADLQRSRFREAAAHFTVDTLYSHPPYAGGTVRVLFQGRDALAHGFATERGPSPVRQVITDLWQRAGRVFVEGVIEGIPNGGTFFSTAQITFGGEIARYVAFYSAERIPNLHPKPN